MPTSTVRAVALHQRDRLFGRAADADGDEHPVRLAAAGDLLDPRGDVLGLASIAWVAPKARAASSLAGATSTAMIGAAPAMPRPLHGIEADAAAADDDDARPGLDLRRC